MVRHLGDFVVICDLRQVSNVDHDELELIEFEFVAIFFGFLIDHLYELCVLIGVECHTGSCGKVVFFRHPLIHRSDMLNQWRLSEV